jgi:hypothetical protein
MKQKLSKNEEKEIKRYKKLRKRRQKTDRHKQLSIMEVPRRIGSSKLGLQKREMLFQRSLPF